MGIFLHKKARSYAGLLIVLYLSIRSGQLAIRFLNQPVNYATKKPRLRGLSAEALAALPLAGQPNR